MNPYQDIILKLKDIGIVFERGMSQQEIDQVEKRYHIVFPTELQQFYSLGLPVSDGFYDWRSVNAEEIKQINRALMAPIFGLQMDLENGEFWCEDWGKQPLDIKAAQSILLTKYNEAPKLVPIRGHRYITVMPQNKTNHIFSILHSDIICYGENLKSFLEIEFGIKPYDDTMHCEYVDFWSDLL